MARKTGSHAEITGPRIRAAALRLFARHGYAAVSMRQIAAEVGMQAGALYSYTPDKQALLFDLMQSHMTHLLDSWAETDHPADPVDALEAFVRFHILYHVERPDEVFISYMELRNLTPPNFEQIEILRKRYETALESILQRGEGHGAFSLPDTRVTTMALIAMLTGVNTWYRQGGRLDRESLVDVYLNLVRRTVGLPKATSYAAQ